MRIDEAILRLGEAALIAKRVDNPEQASAFSLGIEALIAWKEHRGTGSLTSPLLLPGETK